MFAASRLPRRSLWSLKESCELVNIPEFLTVLLPEVLVVQAVRPGQGVLAVQVVPLVLRYYRRQVRLHHVRPVAHAVPCDRLVRLGHLPEEYAAWLIVSEENGP